MNAFGLTGTSRRFVACEMVDAGVTGALEHQFATQPRRAMVQRHPQPATGGHRYRRKSEGAPLRSSARAVGSSTRTCVAVKKLSYGAPLAFDVDQSSWGSAHPLMARITLPAWLRAAVPIIDQMGHYR